MNNMDEKKKKGSVLKKRLIIGIIICSALNLLLIFGVVCCGANFINAINTNIKIEKELVPLCLCKDYVYEDTEGSSIKMNYYNELDSYGDGSSSKSITSFNYYSVHFLLRSENYYYFLFEFDINSWNHWSQEYCIYKCNNELEEFEEVINLGQGISDWRSGYDDKMYYIANDSYYCFDFKTSQVLEDDAEHKSEMMLKLSNEEYISSFEIESGKCNKIDKICTFSYQGTINQFDENIINSDVLDCIYRFGFKPKYHYSYPSGRTAIFYYSSNLSCLLIDYERNEGTIVGYQLFSYCHSVNFNFFNKVMLDDFA